MATTREKIDSRGRNLLQLLEETESQMANLMNPSTVKGIYQGPDPDNPVDIVWPRDASRVNQELGANQIYFLREYNLDGENMSQFGDGSGILTQEEHDTGVNSTAFFDGKANADKIRNKQTLWSQALGADGSNFMKLKGRKSLLTLYWEMRGAFVDNNNKGFHWGQGQDGQDKTFTNRYSNEEDGYQDQFFNKTRDIYFPPFSEIGMMVSAQSGFNLGQPLGADPTVIARLINAGRRLAEDFFEGWGDVAGMNENPFLRAYWDAVSGIVIGPPERVSQLFKPGWARPNLPRLEVQPFYELIQQNLLLPPNTGLLDAGGANDTQPTMSSTFGEMYLRNRSARPGYGGRFSKGTIAGTGINDLQEPLKTLDGELASGGRYLSPDVDVPFTFAEDAHYLSHYKKHAGFISNGRNTQSNPGAMEAAVADFDRSATPRGEHREGSYRSNAAEVVGISDGQYFPFTFATINKKNSRMQLCTLQATIQSLAESYTPTWQSKHFFGRSEQVHTYTFTDRTVDISFVVFADSMRQLQNVYERVLWLAQQCYPDYDNNDRIASGPMIAMRVGDLFQYKAGFIRSLSYDWSFLGPGGKWELTKGMRIPQACNVTMSYQIIHEKVPDRDYNFYGGPAGGISAGMKQQKRIMWWEDDSDLSEMTTSNADRYIPTHTLLDAANPDGHDYGEIGYLDHIDATNAARFTSVSIPNADAIDQFTGTRSLHV